MPSSPVKDYSCQVIRNDVVGNQLYILTLKSIISPETPELFQCQAGQFVMIDLPTPVFHFRRPMSVLSVNNDGSFDVFYKVHGQGTQMMTEFKTGQMINILGPLGNTFTPATEPESALLIGGGIGIAPMYILGSEIKAQGLPSSHCYYGVRSQEEIGLNERLEQCFGQQLYLSSDDGSIGLHGHVGQLLAKNPERIKAAKEAYICGPTVMMKACTKLLLEINPKLRVEVSLEEHMPCGTGACTGCVVFRCDQDLPSKTCVDGPVFNAQSLAWDIKTTEASKASKKTETTSCSQSI